MANGDSKPPRFILSYARRERDSFLERFFKDLRREVAFKEGLDNDPKNQEPGFRDTDGIPNGVDWSEALAEALQHSWACISLYTPNYFKREACGKEFQVFLDRAGVQYEPDGAAKGSRGIIPVLWAGKDDLARHRLPPVVTSKINFRAKKHQERYEREGLRQILKRSPRTAYLDILDDIVADLIDGFTKRPNPLPAPPSFAGIKDAFAKAENGGETEQPVAGPATVALFLVVHADVPATGEAGAASWVERLEDYDDQLHVNLEVIDPGATTAAALTQRVEASSTLNALTLVVVDPATALAQPNIVRPLLQACADSERWTGAIVIPATDTPLPIADAIHVPPANVDRILVSTPEANATGLAREIPTLVIELLKRVIGDSDVHRHAPGGGTPSDRPKIHGPAEPRARV